MSLVFPAAFVFNPDFQFEAVALLVTGPWKNNIWTKNIKKINDKNTIHVILDLKHRWLGCEEGGGWRIESDQSNEFSV